MGWRFVWTILIERDDEHVQMNPLVKWAVVGLAIFGIASVVVYRALR